MPTAPKCLTCGGIGLIQHPALMRVQWVDCPDCPTAPDAPDCTECGGSGRAEREVNRVVYRYGQEFEVDEPCEVDCSECDGTGKVYTTSEG